MWDIKNQLNYFELLKQTTNTDPDFVLLKFFLSVSQNNFWNKNTHKKLFSVMGGKFKFSAHQSDLASFVGNGTKVKIPSEIKPPLIWKCLLWWYTYSGKFKRIPVQETFFLRKLLSFFKVNVRNKKSENRCKSKAQGHFIKETVKNFCNTSKN